MRENEIRDEEGKDLEGQSEKVKADNFKRCCYIFGFQIILIT